MSQNHRISQWLAAEAAKAEGIRELQHRSLDLIQVVLKKLRESARNTLLARWRSWARVVEVELIVVVFKMG